MEIARFQSGLRSMETTHQTLLVLRCKVVVVGDQCVGKSALVKSFSQRDFPKNYMMTPWVEFHNHRVNIPDTNASVELYLFDCAGQQVFNQSEVNSAHFQNAAFIMAVYDVSEKVSFDSVEAWVQKVRAQRPPGSAPLNGVLIANKVDLREDGIDSRAVISTQEGAAKAAALGLEFFETSAAQGQDVDNPFHFIADQFHKKYQETVRKAELVSVSALN